MSKFFYNSLLFFLFSVAFFLFPHSIDAQTTPQPLLLYSAAPKTYNWTVNGTTYTNNKNPFGFELYDCTDTNGTPLNDISIDDQNTCIPPAITKNGFKWWTGSCVTLQPQYNAPLQTVDSRTINGTGQRNSALPICSLVSGQQSSYPFISVSKQFTYDSRMCDNNNAVVLAPRSDITSSDCTSVSINQLLANPRNYSQAQLSCLMYVDNLANLTACRNGNCNTITYIPPKAANGNRPLPTQYQDVCSVFTQGSGVYNISFQAYDTGVGVYGSSSFYLTWLYSTINGSVYLDDNKNGIKDAGEKNYSGTISVNASRGTVTTNAGNYTIPDLTAGDVMANYISLPSGYNLTYPLNGPPPSFQVTVGAACNTNGANGSSCSGGNATNLNFGITNLKPWLQSTCGSIRDDNGITNPVPVGSKALLTAPGCSAPGIAFSGDGSALFSPGQASNTNWIVGGLSYPEVYTPTTTGTALSLSYANLLAKQQHARLTTTNLSTVCTLSSCTLPATLPHGIYTATGNVTLNTYTFPANQNYIFLINGNLTIAGPMLVPQGSGATALFSSSGNIVVNASVGTVATSTQTSLDGIYSTDRSFILPSAGTCTDLRLNIGGNIITNAGRTGGTFQNNRDLCANDATYPTVSFTQRLDLLLNTPTFLEQQESLTTEVAP